MKTKTPSAPKGLCCCIGSCICEYPTCCGCIYEGTCCCFQGKGGGCKCLDGKDEDKR